MKKQVLYWIVGLIILVVGLIILSFFKLIPTPITDIFTNLFKNSSPEPGVITISVDPSTHQKYGFSYPLTYQIKLNKNKCSSFIVSRKYNLGDQWTTMHTPAGIFNGVEAVRFDKNKNIAYVSIAFSNGSDNIYLKITDQSGNPISITEDDISVCKYYDNRLGVVTASADDWDDQIDKDFIDACNAFQNSKAWLTVGIISDGDPTDPFQTSQSTWNDIQTELNQGYIEAASHSKTHPIESTTPVPYADVKSEVEGSKETILAHLNFPASFRMNTTQYLYTWIEPCGYCDADIRTALSYYGYVVDRKVMDGDCSDQKFQDWDYIGLYNRFGANAITPDTLINGPTDPNSQVYKFNQYTYKQNGIYGFFFHPQDFDNGQKTGWKPNNNVIQLLAQISGKTDLWYASLGQLYLYQLMTQMFESGCVSFRTGQGTNQGWCWFDPSYRAHVWPVVDLKNQKTNFVGIDLKSHPVINYFIMLRGEPVPLKTITNKNYSIKPTPTPRRVVPLQAGTIREAESNGNGTFQNIRIIPCATPPYNSPIFDPGWFDIGSTQRVWPANMDGDGNELVGVNSSGIIMKAKINSSDGTYTPQEYNPSTSPCFISGDREKWFSPTYTQRVWPADINGDGKDELAGIELKGNIVAVTLSSNGTYTSQEYQSSTFQSTAGWFNPKYAQRVWPADIEGVGKDELVGIKPDGTIVVVKINDGKVVKINNGNAEETSYKSSAFKTCDHWFDTTSTQRVWPADIDGDGRDELIGVSPKDGTIVVVKIVNGKATVIGNGSSFSPTSEGWFNTDSNQRVWCIDINGDKKADIVGIQYDGSIVAALSNGDGSFKPTKVMKNINIDITPISNKN